MNIKIKKNDQARIEELISQGLNREEIAEKLDISLRTLITYANKYGIKLPNNRDTNLKLEEIIKLRKDRKSVNEIKRMLRTSGPTIKEAFEKLNNGKDPLPKDTPEQLVIKIKELITQGGLTRKEIANRLKIDLQTLVKYAKVDNIKLPNLRAPDSKFREIIDLRKQGYSIPYIAKSLKVSQESIYLAIEKYELDPKNIAVFNQNLKNLEFIKNYASKIMLAYFKTRQIMETQGITHLKLTPIEEMALLYIIKTKNSPYYNNCKNLLKEIIAYEIIKSNPSIDRIKLSNEIEAYLRLNKVNYRRFEPIKRLAVEVVLKTKNIKPDRKPIIKKM
ncbi:MAG: hypothetical protein V1824_00050 [archaeon]